METDENKNSNEGRGTSELMRGLGVPTNRLNIVKPDFLPWESAFLLTKTYFENLDEEEISNTSICRRVYDIKYAPGEMEEMSIHKKVNQKSYTIIIERYA